MNTDCQCVVFANKAYNAIMNEAFNMSPNETGGILLGHILDNGYWIVMDVIPPGWNSIFQYAYFEYDEQFVNYLAKSIATEYGEELSLLGLWHRHPGSMDTFSGTDDGTNRTFAGLHPKGAISGLVNIDPRFRLTMYHCSNPLRYTKVDVEVGDDLIPEEYFRLKYYEEGKELNPMPPQKKSDTTSSERQYEINSGSRNIQNNPPPNSIVMSENRNNTSKNSSIMSTILRFLDLKNVFFLLFLVGATLSLALSFAYCKAKEEGCVKELHRIIYCISPNDSIMEEDKKDAEISFNRYKENPLREELQKDTMYAKDSMKIEKEIKARRQKDVNLAQDIYLLLHKEFFYEKLSMEAAESQVKLIVFFAWVATVILLLIAFVLRKRKYICDIFQRKQQAKVAKTGFWYQRNPNLYRNEEAEIRKRFADAEKNVENGVVSFFINTYKKIVDEQDNLSFQLVYSSDYLENREIKVYLVSPDLDELLGDKIKDFPHIAVDGAGESYLDLSKTLPKDKVSGIEVIRKFYAWIQQYQEWKNHRIKLKDINL